jgi:DNA polymerase III subunit epsilon
MNKPLCFVDIETTGMSAVRDSIIEVAIIKLHADGREELYETLVDPGDIISPSTNLFSDITYEELHKAPTFRNISAELFAFLEGSIFVAHNVQFDYNFLKNAFARVGEKLDMPRIDTVQLSKTLYPDAVSNSLDAIIDRCNIGIIGTRHRAMPDTRATLDFYTHCIQEFDEVTVENIMETLISC